MNGDLLPAFLSLLAPTATFLIASVRPSDPFARRLAFAFLGVGLVAFLWLVWPLTRYVSGSGFLYNGYSFGEQLILALVSLLDLSGACAMYMVTRPRPLTIPSDGRKGKLAGAGRKGKRHGGHGAPRPARARRRIRPSFPRPDRRPYTARPAGPARHAAPPPDGKRHAS